MKENYRKNIENIIQISVRRGVLCVKIHDIYHRFPIVFSGHSQFFYFLFHR